MNILWESSYSVGIKSIDEQHKKLLAILNALLDDIKEKKFSKNLGDVIDELINYTNLHFKMEETLFEKYGFPDSKAHIKKHQEFLDKINGLKRDHQDSNLEAVYELVDFLEDWFIEHINGTDKRYSKFMLEKGVK